jgi:divalent metal cation (Fe/Co/Zn/Cd) transporter
MAEKPKTASILSLVGGVFVLVVGFLIVNGALTGGFNFGLLGVMWGALIMVGAAMLYSRPQQHKTWGIIVIVLSFLSWFVLALAGIIGIIGLILGLIGGGLGIKWKPSVVQPTTPSQPQHQRKSKT